MPHTARRERGSRISRTSQQSVSPINGRGALSRPQSRPLRILDEIDSSTVAWAASLLRSRVAALVLAAVPGCSPSSAQAQNVLAPSGAFLQAGAARDTHQTSAGLQWD